MAKRTPTEELILVSAELVRTDVGARFVAALTATVEEAREAMVFAPNEHIHYAQGVARQGTVLLKQLRGAPDLARKIIEGEHQRAQAAEQRRQQ